MAVFNPNVAPGKDNMPDWTKVSSPTSGYEADKSTGLALKATGDAITGGVDIAETAVKDIINKDVRSTVEKTREEYTQDLLDARATLEGQKPKNDLMEGVGPTGPVPAAIDSGLRRVEKIQNMLVTGSGKIAGDDTYYDMRLKNDVTALRSRYPGFVDYIDQRVSQITGMNPANEAVKDLTRQLAQLQSSRKTEFDKTLDLARGAMTKGLQNADTMYFNLLQQGEAGTEKFLRWYTEENAKFTRLEYADKLRKFTDTQKADFKEVRERDFTNEANTALTNNMNTLLKITGMEEGKTALQMLDEFQHNPTRYNQQQMQEFAAKLLAQGRALDAQLDARAAKTDKDDKGNTYSYNSDVGAAKIQEIKKNVLNYYTQMHDALVNGGPQGPGIAFFMAQQAVGQLSTTKYQIYQGVAGENLRRLEVIKNSMGDTAMAATIQQFLKNGVDEQLSGLFQKNITEAKLQPDPNKPTTYVSMENEALNAEKSGQINTAMRKRYLDKGMKIMLDDITRKDATDPEKINALRFFFSPEGQGVLYRLNNDRYNPITGKYEPGRQKVWNDLTSPAVVESVAKLKNPVISQMYQNWIHREASAHLYQNEIRDLNTFTGRDDLYFKFNDQPKDGRTFIELQSDKGALESPVGKRIGTPQYGIPQYDPEARYNVGGYARPEGQIAHVQAIIHRVNDALAGVSRVDKGLGQDESAASLLQFLIRSQVDLGKNWEGLPKQLMDAIAANQGKGKLRDVMEKGTK